jgi:hypothetical protein
LSLLPIRGAVVGAPWGAFLCLLIVPPIWLISFRLLRQQQGGWQGAAQAGLERCASCLLALLSVPLLWAIAIMAVPAADDHRAALAAAL